MVGFLQEKNDLLVQVQSEGENSTDVEESCDRLIKNKIKEFAERLEDEEESNAELTAKKGKLEDEEESNAELTAKKGKLEDEEESNAELTAKKGKLEDEEESNAGLTPKKKLEDEEESNAGLTPRGGGRGRWGEGGWRRLKLSRPAARVRADLSRELEEISERLEEVGGETSAQIELNKNQEAEFQKRSGDLEESTLQHEAAAQESRRQCC
ncbi:uncharacterized protein LOC142658961 [Rhinoderma darwinii]|uniref:uncharacterized protein LOC142658961 n=1 Tax=Rhinoderma darwinii TaxID=43563 RepID=UPI003F663496